MRRKFLCTESLKRFGSDTNAVSALEFALLLPVIIMLLLGSFDITRAVEAKNKSVLLSRTLADFVAQNQNVTVAQLAGIVKASKFVLSPFHETAKDGTQLLTISIESINKLANNTYQTDWSYPPANSQNRVATAVPDVSAIRANVSYKYQLRFAGGVLSNFGVSELVLNSTTTMSPRWGTPVTANGW